jgi:hypothetical protein
VTVEGRRAKMTAMKLRVATLAVLSAAACNVPTTSISLSGGETRAIIEPQDVPGIVGRTTSLQFGAFQSTYARCGSSCLDDPGLDVIPVTVLESYCEPGCVITNVGSNAMRPAVGVVTVAATRAGTSELTLRLDLGGGREKIAHRSLEFRAPSHAWIFSRAGDGVAMIAGATTVVQATAGESETDRGLVHGDSPGVALAVEGDAVALRPTQFGWDMDALRPGTATLALDIGGAVDRRPIRVVDRGELVALDILRQDYAPTTALTLLTRFPAVVRVVGVLGDGAAALLPRGAACTVEPSDLAKLTDQDIEHGIAVAPLRVGSGVLRCGFDAATVSRDLVVRE